MTTQFHFQEIKESDEQLLEKYCREKKLGRLEKLLQHGNFELAKFVVSAKYHSRHSVFLVRLGLNFSGKDLRAEDKGGALLEAFDLAFDRIINQLRRTESKRHDK